MALYRVPERVERDGRLVAFEGELMSIEEAKRRGIYLAAADKPAEKPAAKKRAPRKRAAKKPETEE